MYQWPPQSRQSLQLQQQPEQGIVPFNVPQNGIPWTCPDWMTNQNIQPGSYMSFNGQQQHRLQAKRKAAPDMES